MRRTAAAQCVSRMMGTGDALSVLRLVTDRAFWQWFSLCGVMCSVSGPIDGAYTATFTDLAGSDLRESSASQSVSRMFVSGQSRAGRFGQRDQRQNSALVLRFVEADVVLMLAGCPRLLLLR